MTERMEASPSPASDLDAIISELDGPFHQLPEKAIQAAQLKKEAIIPGLIALIEDATRAVQAGREVKTNGHFFAVYLLAEFRACEALPAILKAISLPDEGPFELFGDAIHEGIPKALAVLAGEKDLDLVTSLIDNKALNEYVRWAAATSLVAMVAAGIRNREEIMQRLRQSLGRALDQQDTELVAGLVITLCDLYPEEAFEDIKEAYAKKLVDESMIQLSNVEHTLRSGRDEFLQKLREKPSLIHNTVAELRHWASFCEPEEEYESPAAAAPSFPRPRPRPYYSIAHALSL